jgi:hypothetical protein
MKFVIGIERFEPVDRGIKHDKSCLAREESERQWLGSSGVRRVPTTGCGLTVCGFGSVTDTTLSGADVGCNGIMLPGAIARVRTVRAKLLVARRDPLAL